MEAVTSTVLISSLISLPFKVAGIVMINTQYKTHFYALFSPYKYANAGAKKKPKIVATKIQAVSPLV